MFVVSVSNIAYMDPMGKNNPGTIILSTQELRPATFAGNRWSGRISRDYIVTP